MIALHPDPIPGAPPARIAVAYTVTFNWHGKRWRCRYPLNHQRRCHTIPTRR